jgi:hypothetical protein
MDTKSIIRDKLQEVYGPFETYLDNVYQEAIIEKLYNGDINSRREWVTYNQVLIEIKNSLKDAILIKELQYRLTDNEPPREVCIKFLDNLKHTNPELNRLYNKIRNF